MSAPHATDYRALIRELLSIWDGHTNDKHAHVRGDLSHATTGILIRGLVAHGVDCARAVLTLYEGKQPAPAMPIVRVLMEDAMTAVWLLGDDDAWKSFIGSGEGQKAVALREILVQKPDEDAEARLREAEQLLNYLGPTSKHAIKQRFDTVDGAEVTST